MLTWPCKTRIQCAMVANKHQPTYTGRFEKRGYFNWEKTLFFSQNTSQHTKLVIYKFVLNFFSQLINLRAQMISVL